MDTVEIKILIHGGGEEPLSAQFSFESHERPPFLVDFECAAGNAPVDTFFVAEEVSKELRNKLASWLRLCQTHH
jgi:hypothetical protein